MNTDFDIIRKALLQADVPIILSGIYEKEIIICEGKQGLKKKPIQIVAILHFTAEGSFEIVEG